MSGKLAFSNVLLVAQVCELLCFSPGRILLYCVGKFCVLFHWLRLLVKRAMSGKWCLFLEMNGNLCLLKMEVLIVKWKLCLTDVGRRCAGGLFDG